MIDPNEEVEYNGELLAIKDLPTAQDRRFFGMGHFPEPGRGVIPNPTGEAWPYGSESCLRADELNGTWITVDEREFLICPGCGMDYT